MSIATTLKAKRQAMGLTQQALAEQLHVTRQTLSRWENGRSYPNLDTLVQLSHQLGLTLDALLKEEQDGMVKQISNDVRHKKHYKWLLISIALLCIAWLGVLSYGHATQNIWIDRFNPFLKTEYGYGILPAKTPTKPTTVQRTLDSGKTKQVTVVMPQEIDTFVSDDPFGNGQWLTFTTGLYTQENRWALVRHKGAYVSNIRLVRQDQIPLEMREQAGNHYYAYPKGHAEPRMTEVRFSPFG